MSVNVETQLLGAVIELNSFDELSIFTDKFVEENSGKRNKRRKLDEFRKLWRIPQVNYMKVNSKFIVGKSSRPRLEFVSTNERRKSVVKKPTEWQ
jgi:hypothetical protein